MGAGGVLYVCVLGGGGGATNKKIVPIFSGYSMCLCKINQSNLPSVTDSRDSATKTAKNKTMKNR